MKLELTLAANVYDRTFALMSGAVAATLLTMVVVPVLYWELRRHEVARASDPLDPYERVDARAAA